MCFSPPLPSPHSPPPSLSSNLLPFPPLPFPPCPTPLSLLQSALQRGTVGEGLAKLLLSGRMVSRRVLAKLILLWYNPVMQDEDRLRGTLGVFFQAFAAQGRYVHAGPLPLLAATELKGSPVLPPSCRQCAVATPLDCYICRTISTVPE